jgi:hypothetical protein
VTDLVAVGFAFFCYNYNMKWNGFGKKRLNAERGKA